MAKGKPAKPKPTKRRPTPKRPPPYQSTLERFPEHVKAIGMISVEFANLEMMLADLLGVLINRRHDIAHAIYFTPKAAIARIDTVDAVADIIGADHPDPAKQCKKFTGRARAIVGKRHRYIHDAWGTPEDGVVQAGPLPLKEGTSRPVDLSELQRVIKDLRDLITEIREAVDDIHAAIWD